MREFIYFYAPLIYIMKYEKVISEIKELKIQGSRNVALHALSILQDLAKRKGFGKEWEDMANFLQQLRPTQVLTYNLIKYVKENRNFSAFNEVKNFLEKSYYKIIENGFKILEGNEVIMTHCHSSEELNLLKFAKKMGYDFEVYVTETRPRLQGLKSAKELANEGIAVKYIVDNAAGYYMKDVDVVMFGIDAIRKEGVWNKIGTYLISIAAKYEKKEVWFIGDILKVDKREKPHQEMRNPREIIGSHRLPKDVEVLNPAFDYTPWELIDGVVTGIGIFNKWEDFEILDLGEIIKNY